MRKSRRGCTGLCGRKGVWSLEALSKEPEVCFGELELAKEGFNIFVCGG